MSDLQRCTLRSPLNGIAAIAALALAAVAAQALAPTAALAQAAQSAQAKQSSAINCTCRYKGRDYGVGQAVCLASPQGPQIARCGFFLNNTSWNFTSTPCALSSLEDAPRSPTGLANSTSLLAQAD